MADFSPQSSEQRSPYGTSGILDHHRAPANHFPGSEFQGAAAQNWANRHWTGGAAYARSWTGKCQDCGETRLLERLGERALCTDCTVKKPDPSF